MKQFIYPYILLKKSKEAADYYKEVFDGEITYVMLGKDMPNCPEDQLENIMHLQLMINNNTIYMADQDVEPKSNIIIHLDYQDEQEMRNVYNKMIKASVVIREMQETFWGAIYGVLKDKFGVSWEFHFTLPKKEE